MIEIINATKKYGNTTALNDVTFNVSDGDIFGIIGHNGAGKTTLIKAIVGIHKLDEGRILIDGKNIENNPIECKMRMAYLPDTPDLYENMIAVDFINFLCDIYGVDVSERELRISKYSKLFEIEDELYEEIGDLSHGQKQKVALIGALCHKPDIIILDEPFVGLDPRAVFDLKEILRNMASEGKTIFFSTHILEVAERLCTQVAIIKNGRLMRLGSIEEIRGQMTLEDVYMQMEAY